MEEYIILKLTQSTLFYIYEFLLVYNIFLIYNKIFILIYKNSRLIALLIL